jgi:hypothetical protein
VRSYIADNDGNFRFSGLDPNADYELHAEKDGAKSQTRNVSSFDSRLDIVLNRSVVAGHVKRFEFVERDADQVLVEAPGLREFLEDPALSGTATEVAVAFLRRLNLKGRRPTPLYYYRELQNLRDPLHFRTP